MFSNMASKGKNLAKGVESKLKLNSVTKKAMCQKDALITMLKTTKPKDLIMKILSLIKPKNLAYRQTEWDKFITEKFVYLGFKTRIAYVIALLNILGMALYYLMYEKDNYYRRFAYDTDSRNRIYKHLTSHFANNNIYVFGATVPLLFVLARKLEILYGSPFLLKLTFISMCMTALSMMSVKVTHKLLPKELSLPIDQVSRDEKYQMGPHGLLATFATFALMKFLRMNIWVAFGLAFMDGLISQRGYWGGYLGGILAFLMF